MYLNVIDTLKDSRIEVLCEPVAPTRVPEVCGNGDGQRSHCRTPLGSVIGEQLDTIRKNTAHHIIY